MATRGEAGRGYAKYAESDVEQCVENTYHERSSDGGVSIRGKSGDPSLEKGRVVDGQMPKGEQQNEYPPRPPPTITN